MNRRTIMMKDRVCGYCGYIGQPTTQGMGSFLVDALIWMIFGSFTAILGLLPLLLVPLGWTIYHIAKYKTVTCPKCGNLEMVSMDNKRGKEILHGASGQPHAWHDEDVDLPHHHAI
jgi:ribosomal protein S27AE